MEYRGDGLSETPLRPENLPDFRSPPLHEVVLGIQFAPVPGQLPLHDYEVWSLFRDEFQKVEEKPPLPPSFETFGLRPMGESVNLEFLAQAPRPRYWFISRDEAELIQYQSDKLFHNWRKVDDSPNAYPRFERMLENFEREAGKLADHFNSLKWALRLTQCEVSYINHIPLGDVDKPNVSRWLSFVDFGSIEAEHSITNFWRVIESDDGKPVGRLYCTAQSAFDSKKRRMIILTLSAKGAPDGERLSDGLQFIKRCREMICHTFTGITTPEAHKYWERIS